MKLRVGVVGLGKAWESRHAPALKALADRFEVRAFCDPVAHRAAEVAHRWPARTCDGFRALAESDDIDAVMLLSARWYGALPILAACDAGKAIYCAAALDLDTDAADAGATTGPRRGRRLHGRVSLPPRAGDVATQGTDGHAARPAAAVVLQSPPHRPQGRHDRATRPTCGN